MDFRDLKPGPPGTNPDQGKGSASPGFWWTEEDAEKRGQRVVATGKELLQQQIGRSQMNLMHARLYGNDDLRSFDAGAYAANLTFNYNKKIALNVVASATDTLTSKIAKSKPKPSFQTNGGSWAMQQKARLLDKFMKGVFYETKIYTKTPLQFLSACIFGTGVLHIFMNDKGRLQYEHVFVDEMYVDDVDAKYGAPRQLLRRKLVQRDVLLATIAKDCSDAIKEKIRNAGVPSETATAWKPMANVVEVWEAWHLPSSPEAKDGYHSISVDGAEVFGEQWRFDFFPFAFLRFAPRVLGFWGQGVAERLSGIQVELNRLIRSVSEQLRRKGRGRILAHTTSKIVPEHFTNGIGDIIRWSGGVPPTVDAANAIAPEEFMQIERLRQLAFQEVGISELSAAAKKPSGLDAAVALREFNDIESERFADLQSRWDQNVLTVAEISIELVRAQGGKGYKQRLPNKRFIVEVDWADIDLKRDDFIMQMFPASSLPTTPAARYQKVVEMKQDGFIDMGVARRLLDFPDIEAEDNLATASLDDVDCVIGYILDDATPKYVPPDKFQNLEALISRGTAALLYARHHGADDERLELLERLVEESEALKLSIMQPPAPPQGAMPPPEAMPMQGPPGPPGPVPMQPLQPAVPPLVAS